MGIVGPIYFIGQGHLSDPAQAGNRNWGSNVEKGEHSNVHRHSDFHPAARASIPIIDGPPDRANCRESYRASLESVRDMGREQFEVYPDYVFNALSCDRANLSGRRLYHDAQIHRQSRAWLGTHSSSVDPRNGNVDAASDLHAERF